MTTDREEYLEGERILVDVLIRNPTPAPLEVWDPFWRAAMTLQRRVDRDWTDREAEWPFGPLDDEDLMKGRRTGIVQPGEEFRMSVDMATAVRNETQGPILHSALDHNPPGEYRVVFTYGYSRPFRIRPVKMTGVVQVQKLPNTFSNGEEHPCYGVMAAVMASDDGTEHIIVAKRAYDCEFNRMVTNLLAARFDGIVGFSRVASSTDAIRAISLRRYGERVEILWESQAGQRSSRMLETSGQYPRLTE